MDDIEAELMTYLQSHCFSFIPAPWHRLPPPGTWQSHAPCLGRFSKAMPRALDAPVSVSLWPRFEHCWHCAPHSWSFAELHRCVIHMPITVGISS